MEGDTQAGYALAILVVACVLVLPGCRREPEGPIYFVEDDIPENTELKDRQVEPKEKVFVPDLIVRQDDGTLKKKNRWLMKKGVPPAIRFERQSR